MLAAVRAALAHNVGDTAVLERSSAEAVELFAQLGDLWGLALARQMRSQWLALAGRFEEALDAAEEATVHLRAITSAWDLQQQQGLAVTLLVRMGRIDEARERATQLLDEAHVTGSSRALLFARLNATMLALTLGELDLAEEQFALAEQAAADWQSAPPQMTALVATASGRLAIATGRFADAVPALDGAASAAVLSADQPVMASVAVALAELAWASGDAAGARDAIGIAETLRGAPDLSDPREHALRERLSAVPDSDEPGTAGEFAAETARIRQILRR
jgi:tetratricopeptide (TPR) repeat protein